MLEHAWSKLRCAHVTSRHSAGDYNQPAMFDVYFTSAASSSRPRGAHVTSCHSAGGYNQSAMMFTSAASSSSSSKIVVFIANMNANANDNTNGNTAASLHSHAHTHQNPIGLLWLCRSDRTGLNSLLLEKKRHRSSL